MPIQDNTKWAQSTYIYFSYTYLFSFQGRVKGSYISKVRKRERPVKADCCPVCATAVN